MFKVTDAEGNEIALSDLVEDVSTLASLQMSDGTSVDISGTDFRTLMQTDFTKVVSVTDQNGNVTDLSEYTISMNFPSGNGEGRNRRMSENTGDSTGSDTTNAAPPDGLQTPEGAQTSERTQTSEGTQTSDGSQTPGDPQAFSAPNGADGGYQPSGGMPGGMPGEMPNGMPEDQQGSLSNNTAVLTGASFLVLAVGLLIAVKKKKTI